MAPKAPAAHAEPATLPPDVLDAATESEAPPPPATEPETPQADPPVEWGNWVYAGPCGRVYTHVPVTVFPGDVVYWPGRPADDGCWSPAPADAQAKQPDNWRPDPGVPTDGAGLYEPEGV